MTTDKCPTCGGESKVTSRIPDGFHGDIVNCWCVTCGTYWGDEGKGVPRDRAAMAAEVVELKARANLWEKIADARAETIKAMDLELTRLNAACDRCNELTQIFARENARLRSLVESAYREARARGVHSSKTVTTEWLSSDSRKALDQQPEQAGGGA